MMHIILISLISINIFAQIKSFDSGDKQMDTVWAGTYRPIVTGLPNRGANNLPNKDIFFFGHYMRVRQNGTITRVQLYCASKSGITGVYLKIWRKNGYTFDLVGVSNNIVNYLDTGQISTLNLTSPIVGVHEGDYYSILIQNGNLNFFATNESYIRTYYTNSNPIGNYNWYQAPMTDSGYNIPVRFYMSAPKIVFMGNSIISGYYQHKSYLETDTSMNNIPVTIPFKVSDSLGWTYQNMAIGGQYTSALKSRFKTDVLDLKPEYVLIEGGINDIINNVSSATIVSNFGAMLDSCTNHNIKAFVVLVQPMSIVSNLNMLKRDSINTQLINLCNQKNHYYADVGQQLGVRRDTGTPTPPPGNLWNLNPIYSSGDGLGIHLNTLGNTVYASAVLTVIRQTIVGINQHYENTPSRYFLSQNYPNPFNPVTKINFSISEEEKVTFKIFNSLGQLVKTYYDEKLKRGYYSVLFDGTIYSSGVYFYTLQTEKYIESKKMLMIK